jgi:hypothetical protein
MNYVRRLPREAGVKGNARYVLMMIAWRVPRGHIESRAVPLQSLERDTGLDRKTVRDCIKRVVAAGLLRVGRAGRGRGNFNTYVMPNLAGPLFMMDGGDGGKGGDADTFSDDVKEGESPGVCTSFSI